MTSQTVAAILLRHADFEDSIFTTSRLVFRVSILEFDSRQHLNYLTEPPVDAIAGKSALNAFWIGT